MSTDAIRWHYTVDARFRMIVADRLLKPAIAFLSWREKPAVWFSTHRVWEPTASKARRTQDGRLVRLTREETMALGGGLVRIGVAPETAPHDWQAYRRLSGVDPRVASGLAKAARAQGADPRQWYVSFEAVPASQWIAVEIWEAGGWSPGSWEGPLPPVPCQPIEAKGSTVLISASADSLLAQRLTRG
jgi:hypothetical protein